MDGGSWHCIGGGDQNHPQEKELQKGKRVVWADLTNSWKKKRVKGKGENERHTHSNSEFKRTARRDKKAFLSDQCKEIEENSRMGKSRGLFKKLEIPRELFMQRE